MLKVNIRILCTIILFACLSPSGVLCAAEHSGLKNLYVLIDPANVKNDDKISLLAEVFYIKGLIARISTNEFSKPLRFDHVVFQIAGSKNREPRVYTRKKLREISSKKLIIAINNTGRTLGGKRSGDGVPHAMTKALGDYSNILDKLGWKGSDTLLLILSDINFVGQAGSSYGGALNSAWLSNPRSPFVRFFLKKDKSFAKGTSVVIFTRTQLDMSLEEMRSAFLINLFDRAAVDMNVYYVGSMKRTYQLRNSFAFDVVRHVQQKRLSPLPVHNLPVVKISQIIRGEGGDTTIRNFK